MNKHTQELARLIMENPEHEVIAMVHEDVNNGDYQYCCADLERPRLDEYCGYGDKIYWRNNIDELEEDIKDYLYCDYEDEDAMLQRCKEILENEILWKKCIVVYVEV